MILGYTVSRLGGEDFLSPPFRKQGNAATFVVEATHAYHNPVLVIRLEHRSPEETTWAAWATFQAITGPGVSVLSVSDMKEFLRFRYSFTSQDPEDSVHLVGPAASWRAY